MTSSAPGRALALLVATLMMAVALARSAPTNLERLSQADLSNPDSYYNLVVLLDRTPEHGHRFVARDNAPHGSWVHWTEPYTWTLWQLHRPLRAAGLGEEPALRYAGGALSLLGMLAVAFFTALAVSSVGTRRTAMVSGLALAACIPLHAYGNLLQITHHVFMLAPLAAAAACLLRAAPAARPGLDLLGGALLALGWWISPEAMPFVVGLVYLRIAARLQGAAPALWPIAPGLFGATLLAWWLDPPPPTFPAWSLDRMSLAWLLLAGLLAAMPLLAEACLRRGLSLARSFAAITAASVLAMLAWALAVPGVSAGPAGLIPAELKTLWWNQIVELQSAHRPHQWMAYFALPVAGALAAGYRAWRERSLWLAALAFMSLAYGLLGVWHLRMGAAAGVAGALAFGIGLAGLRGFGDTDETLSRRRQLGVFLLTVFPALQLGATVALASLWPPPPQEKHCSLASVAPTLQRIPPATFLAPVFSGSELLYRTHHRIITGPYHHNVDGLLDNYRGWLYSGTDHPPEMFARRGIGYVLGCTHYQNELRGSAGRRTLMERVADGDVPPWLQPQPWPAGTDTEWRLYRVAPWAEAP
jgi:hypothetical protein